MKNGKELIGIGVLAVLGLFVAGGAMFLLRPESGENAPAQKGSVRQTHSALDTSFAQMMIAHHKQALEMTQLTDARAQSPEVKALADKIDAGQGPEIETMTGWLRSWGEPVEIPTANDPGMGGHDTGAHISGMMTPEEMTRLKSSQGAAFDQAFLEMMIAHHEGAIEMARTQTATGQYAPAKELAAKIHRSQTEEIEGMRRLLRDVKGSAG